MNRYQTLLLLPLLSLLPACGSQQGWEMPPPVVEADQAVQRDWTVTYETTGTLEANNKVDLNVEAPGTITRLAVREGDRVRRGQVLVRLKADKQLAQVQQSAAGIAASRGGIEQERADIQQAQARLESALLRKNFAQSEYERYEKLFRDQFISQFELDQKRNNYDTALAAYTEAQEALSSAKARLHQASSSLAQAKSNYRYSVALANESVITAPFSGVVGERYVDLGDYVAPTEKIMTVVDPSRFRIGFEVPERYLGQLRKGLPVTVRFEGLGDRVFSGEVEFIDPVVDADTRTVRVKAVLPASQGLRHGMFGTVNLALGKIANTVVVPEEAIVPQGEKTFVYVVRNEIPKGSKDKKTAPVAHLQEVVVGYRDAGHVQLRRGLNPGARVLVGGLQKVNDGIVVNLGGNATPAAGGMKPPEGE